MPDPVTIQNRPVWCYVMLGLWLVQALVGLAFGAAGITRLGAAENGEAYALLLMALLMIVPSVVLGAQSLRMARIKGPALVISDEGLRDRRIFDGVIPWDDIVWRIVFNGRSYVIRFDVKESTRSRLPVRWDQRATARFYRLFGYPEFPLPTLGTGRSVPALATELTRFKAEG